LLAGERDAGVTVIHMTPQLDGGPILAIRSTEIQPTETAGELEARLGKIGVEATLEAISLLASWDRGAPIGQPQERGHVTKAPRLKKSEGEIDWSKSSAAIDRHVRGMQPWPVAFTHVTLDSHKPPVRLAVKEVADTSTPRPDDAAPGQVIGEDGLRVVTGDGVVEIRRLQPAGRREMSGADFVRGLQQPPESLRLGSPATVS
jgi:methionyl-tRNA formyltransferase